jgi:murein DD-endopeptidase MepM/ murein hydrolase activator NlpD
MNSSFSNTLKKYQSIYHGVVPFDAAKDHLQMMDFTEKNSELNAGILENTGRFTDYIHHKLVDAKAKYGIGGYAENRTVYSRSRVFDAEKPGGEPRRIHLGIDIWGEEGTPVFAPMGGMVHSFAFNDHYGDYGATIVLLHQLDGLPFYTLYGHLSLRDIDHLSAGQYVVRGEKIAHFGNPEENGHWPPHLHFQVMLDMELYEGDYPGVCRYSEKDKYLANCPDPDLILQLNQFIS